MHPTIELDYFFAAIGFIFVLLILGKRDLKLWLRLLILFFIPPFISAFPYAIFTNSSDSVTHALGYDLDTPILRYSTFTSAMAYGLGRVLLPNIIFCVTYLIIKLSKRSK